MKTTVMAFALALVAAMAVMVWDGGGNADAAERKLGDDEIMAFLPTIVATGDNTRQTFTASGNTTYSISGRDTFGTWTTRGGQYCSQWPPSTAWACYDVLLDDAPGADGAPQLIWISESGERILNGYMKK